MRNLLVVSLALAAAMVFSVDASAAEKAATDQVPAALTELGVQPAQIMTVEEAEDVRGEWMHIYINGMVSTSNFSGQVYANGYASYFSIYVNPYTFAMTAY